MAVGSNDDVLIFNDVSKTKILDLNGKTTVPGFIDSHSHIGDYTQLWGLPNLALPPVGTVNNFADINKIIRSYISQNNISIQEFVLWL
ncbi:unnamed protein product [Didymodactylos carnosus]|uniref:Amidohydrolase 3 domain-containing protein n=1 Tax=Didymodactylos carnosus TaxID=1234261 RepID=A0A8S2YF88_9BILA|nr:unnamed protein product [Didymodactylos carnosus]